MHAKTWLMTTLSRLLGVLCLEMYRVSKSAFKSHMTIIRPHHGILYCVDSKKFLRDCYHCKLFAFVYSSTNKNLVINWTQGLMKNYCVFWEKEIYKPLNNTISISIGLEDLWRIAVYSEKKKYISLKTTPFQIAFENEMKWVNIHLKS